MCFREFIASWLIGMSVYFAIAFYFHKFVGMEWLFDNNWLVVAFFITSPILCMPVAIVVLLLFCVPLVIAFLMIGFIKCAIVGELR